MLKAIPVLLLLTVPAVAADKPTAIECFVVRKAVESYGEAAMISLARAKGMSESQIDKAKRCLK